MIFCNRIDLIKRIDVVKRCQYWHFNHGFKFQKLFCNVCHDLMMLCLNIGDIAIITVKGADYPCIFNDIYKSDAFNLLENYILDDCGYIWNVYQKSKCFK